MMIGRTNYVGAIVVYKFLFLGVSEIIVLLELFGPFCCGDGLRDRPPLSGGSVIVCDCWCGS